MQNSLVSKVSLLEKLFSGMDAHGCRLTCNPKNSYVEPSEQSGHNSFGYSIRASNPSMVMTWMKQHRRHISDDMQIRR